MASLNPKSRFNDFIDQINVLREHGVNNEVLVQSAKRFAATHQSEDAFESFLLKGIISSYEDRPVETVKAYFEKAQCIKRSDWALFLNYAVSMRQLGFVDTAYHIAQNARSFACKDEEAARSARLVFTAIALSSLRINETARIDNDYLKFALFLENLGVDDSDLKPFGKAIENVAKKHHLHMLAPSVKCYPDECILDVRFPLKADLNTVVHLADELNEELLDADLSAAARARVNVGFAAL